MGKNRKEDMSIVFVGHVDHGKSTIIGRLLADTDSLPKGKLQQIQENCRRNSKPFEYAFLLDALKDEQAQGITIDSARAFFKTKKRDYIIIDAPGHIEFLKNMVTGASRAQGGLLVIDAHEGIKENSKRHGYLLSMLGIKQIILLVNKMDLVQYSQEVYKKIVKEYNAFLQEINVRPLSFIPISGFKGDNITEKSSNMPWFKGDPLLKNLDKFKNEKNTKNKPLRIPVQGIYKFTSHGDNRRIIAGTIESGTISKGDDIIFYPSGKKTKVKGIETFPVQKKNSISAPFHCGFTMEEQIYVKRGEIVCKEGEKHPLVSTRIKCNIFWLGQKDLTKEKVYFLKSGTNKVKFQIESIETVMDASTLEKTQKEIIARNDVASCILSLNSPLAFENIDKDSGLGRFVIVDNFEISGGGIITDSLEYKHEKIREKVWIRNEKWIRSLISKEERAEKYSQRAHTIIISGKKGSGRKRLARELEKKLFQDGRLVYYIGMGNIVHGLDSDIEDKSLENREEHLRRFAEVAHLLTDAGIILIVTALEVTEEEFRLIKTINGEENVSLVKLGDSKDKSKDSFYINVEEDTIKNSTKIKSLLQNKGVIFNPWKK